MNLRNWGQDPDAQPLDTRDLGNQVRGDLDCLGCFSPAPPIYLFHPQISLLSIFFANYLDYHSGHFLDSLLFHSWFLHKHNLLLDKNSHLLTPCLKMYRIPINLRTYTAIPHITYLAICGPAPTWVPTVITATTQVVFKFC